jgi:hypothetical protein
MDVLPRREPIKFGTTEQESASWQVRIELAQRPFDASSIFGLP